MGIVNPPMNLEVSYGFLLALVQIKTGYNLRCQPVPPDRGHELPGPFLEVRGREPRRAAAVDHIQRAAAGFFDVAGQI